MKKMKIIDLLNKVANGEEVPTKFTYISFLWEYDIRSKMWFTYYQKDGETLNHRLDRVFFLNLCLNDEVEIIEDEIVEDVPKEVNGIKKLNLTGENQLKLKTNKQEYNIRVVDKIIINKINEIIDKEY